MIGTNMGRIWDKGYVSVKFSGVVREGYYNFDNYSFD